MAAVPVLRSTLTITLAAGLMATATAAAAQPAPAAVDPAPADIRPTTGTLINPPSEPVYDMGGFVIGAIAEPGKKPRADTAADLATPELPVIYEAKAPASPQSAETKPAPAIK